MRYFSIASRGGIGGTPQRAKNVAIFPTMGHPEAQTRLHDLDSWMAYDGHMHLLIGIKILIAAFRML